MGIVHTRGFRNTLRAESAWYWPLAASLARFSAHAAFPTPEELSALYRERSTELALPALRFVAAQKIKRKRGRPIELAELYEGRIVERGEVPTRPDDWHDFFNALAFVTFPRAKYALHQRQYTLWRARIAPGATRLPNARTREQDALSLFDEGGLCVVAPPELAAALRSGPEEQLHAALAGGTALAVPFGHALYEHMVADLPCPLATPYVIALDELEDAHGLLAELDAALAHALVDPGEFLEPSSARGCSLAELAAREP